MQSGSDKRLREIVGVLSSYGFHYLYNDKIKHKNREDDPKNLRLAFEKLGPSFIRIGQILSTRVDLFPQRFIDELAKLQDAAPVFAFEEVERIFLEDTRVPLNEVFASVEKEPLASASVAQVHKGVLLTGEEVILKVQRPMIDELLIQDLDILIQLSEKIPQKFIDVVDPAEALRTIKENTLVELDFQNEGRMIQKFRGLNEMATVVGVPEVYSAWVTRRILVEEYIAGIKITNKKELEKQGYDLEEISRKLILAYLKQIFEDGFFHGDPHPGNIIIREGKIFFIDFGIMGELSKTTKKSVNTLLVGLATNDIDLMVNVVLELGTPNGIVDKRKLYADIEILFDKYLSNNILNVEMTAFLTDFIRMFKKYNIEIPSNLTILVKALGILEGVFMELSPELNLTSVAKDYLKEMNSLSKVLQSFSVDELTINGYRFVKEAAEIPGNALSLLKQLLGGRTILKIEIEELDERWADLKKMANRLVIALIVSGLLLASAILSGTPGGRQMGQIGFVFAGVLGLWLLLSIFKSGKL